MKKILSFLLAAAFICALLPLVYADTADYVPVSLKLAASEEILRSDFTLLTDNIRRLDEYMVPRAYVPIADQEGVSFNCIDSPYGKAFKIATSAKNLHPTIRVTPNEKYRGITEGIIVVETYIMVGTTVDQFKMAEGMGGINTIFDTNGFVSDISNGYTGTVPYKRGDWARLQIVMNLDSDKAEIYYTDVLKKYPFPVFEGEKFIPESIVWDRIAKDGYKLRYFNTIIYHFVIHPLC